MTVKRYNSIGRKYELSEAIFNQTRIWNGGKAITVAQPIEVILAGWFKWQNKGMFVQDAFPMLSSDEREFLMTGLTQEQWAKLFPLEVE
jgi:hypothetical protein